MLRGVDQELIPHLLENIKKLGMDSRTDTPFTAVEKADNGMLRVILKEGGFLEAE
jgi:pyruvate/2-oxoglutarate dehydrogenase complex dihydrolipoamide dehydrogenase (E3) component